MVYGSQQMVYHKPVGRRFVERPQKMAAVKKEEEDEEDRTGYKLTLME